MREEMTEKEATRLRWVNCAFIVVVSVLIVLFLLAGCNTTTNTVEIKGDHNTVTFTAHATDGGTAVLANPLEALPEAASQPATP